MRERAWRLMRGAQVHNFLQNETRTGEKTCITLMIINRMWLIRTTTKNCGGVAHVAPHSGAIPAHRSHAAGCFKTLSPLLFAHFYLSTSFIAPSSSSTPTYNPSFQMTSYLKKEKKQNITKGPGIAIISPMCLPPLSPFFRPQIHPKKRAKDVERWIISPRYNLTVTLRCHLLRRTALLMSPTLHVSHFPAN